MSDQSEVDLSPDKPAGEEEHGDLTHEALDSHVEPQEESHPVLGVSVQVTWSTRVIGAELMGLQL